MHQDWKIKLWEEEYVYIQIWVARRRFKKRKLPHRHQAAQVAFWVDISSVPASPVGVGRMEVHLYIWASSVSAVSARSNFGKEGSRLYDFHGTSLSVFPAQPSPCYAEETELPASSLFVICCQVFGPGILLPLLQHPKILLCPFWPYSMQGACQTVLAVPDLLALP